MDSEEKNAIKKNNKKIEEEVKNKNEYPENKDLKNVHYEKNQKNIIL